MKKYWFDNAYLPTGWETAVSVLVNDSGRIKAIKTNTKAQDAIVIRGLAMPGFANVHSHAFQRVMAGLNEVSSAGEDTFWRWRELMYSVANTITPAQQRTIAAQLYMEMLQAGYTSVAEFHYLHHQPSGQHYDDPAVMSEAVISAADDTGIGLTHLPVLYMYANFGNTPPVTQQRRFIHSIDSFQHLVSLLHKRTSKYNNIRLGIAFHSIRAVCAQAMNETLSYLNQLDQDAPIHIHIAEQTREVEQCVQWSGQRPVQWLLEQQSVDKRWCLVHATHLQDDEITALAQSGATVGLCPTTEANLGDGFFPVQPYLDQGGHFALGSDSNVSISPIEELRWLEYGQRLLHQRRNIISTQQSPHTGAHIVEHSLQGGAAALARKTGQLAVDHIADIIVLDQQSALLYNKPKRSRLDTLVFGGNHNLVRDVIVAGQWVVKNYAHIQQKTITDNYRQLMQHLQLH